LHGRVKLEAMEGDRDVRQASAARVAVLEAVLGLERVRLAEIRQEADRWREAATVPRSLWAWLKRA
jgi:hypothetical protein